MNGAGLGDSKSQVKAVAVGKGDAMSLFDGLTNLSISLVMGVEQYLRHFDTAQAMPVLVAVIEKYVEDNCAGDIMVMVLRCVSLVLEHVPSSYDGAQELHKPLMRLTSLVLHKALCMEWTYGQTDTESLLEECLRTIRFVGKDDRTGTIVRHALMGDLLTLCASENTLRARQGLETLQMLCSKVVMPSEFEKPSQSGGFFSLFKSKKKSSKSHDKALSTDDSDSPIVINVENVIAPFLHTLIEQHAAALPHMQEVWPLLEHSMQCLGTLMERALLCHRPGTARGLVSPELPRLLFRVITNVEENVSLELSVRNERILFMESMLVSITSCNRRVLADSLLTAEAKRFFHSILIDSNAAITTLLDQPFPLGVMAARSTQRRDKDHITSMAAIRLFVLATPNVPPDAFGLKPKVVLPVHQWMWEDELRHANRLVEEQCVALETSWTRLARESAMTVHTKSLPADLLTMTMARGFSGGYRNISRSFVPFVYHFVDETTVRPIAHVKEAGPEPVKGAVGKPSPSHSSSGVSGATLSSSSSKRESHSLHNSISSGKGAHKPSFSATDSQVVMNENAYVPESHIAIAEEYFIPLCDYATYAPGQMAKQLATCACASILQLLFLSNADARVGALMKKAMLPLCEMFRAALASADKATKAVVLTMTEWLLQHSMASHWPFCDTAHRCGYVSLLDDMSKITPIVAVSARDARPTRTADLADRSGELVRDISARLLRPRGVNAGRGGASVAVETARLEKAAAALRDVAKQAGTHDAVLKHFFTALHLSQPVTAFEVHQMELASTALCYLLGGTTAEDLLGPSFVFSSGASGSTFSRSVVKSVDIASLLDNQQSQSPAMLMIARGMRVGDLMHLHVSQPRLQSFIRLVAAAPAALQQLVEHLVGTITLQSVFPSVESLITHERVVCKTPLQAFQALSDISPRAVLCGRLGQVVSPAYVSNGAPVPEGIDTREQSAIFGDTPTRFTTNTTNNNNNNNNNDTNNNNNLTTTATVPNLSGGKGGAGSTLTVAIGATTNAASDGPPALHPPDYCMRGHKLKEMPSYSMSCVCDLCGAQMRSGYACRVCNFDLCRQCRTQYKGNATLLSMIQAPSTMPRNRANLVACIGDVERYFRTGSTSTKGTQVAPTTQSSLSHLDRFCARAELLLSRKANDAGAPSGEATVARLLLTHRSLLRQCVHKTLQGFYTRGTLPGDPALEEAATPLSPDGAAPVLTEQQASIAAQLTAEAVEDRYILYRPTVGRCAYQESFLSVVYAQAFALGNRQVLLQLENCLLRPEGSAEPLTLPAASAMPSSQNSVSARNASPRDGATPQSSVTNIPAAASTSTVPTVVMDEEGDTEFAANRITPQQTFVFHHFENDSAATCSCGRYTREDFATRGPTEMTQVLPDFARRADVLLLILLHRTFYSASHAVMDCGVDHTKLDETVFVNSAVTTAFVKSLEASALRAAVLPPQFALPRWTSFVLNEARFLLPPNARERIARFLAYGARRSFIMYMRIFRQYRLDRTVSISPGEWARMSNHKFTINRAHFLRDAYTVLRKTADARLPISIEFVGDVGVGQGPTAHFYTLLAQEVSKASLDLWRNVKAAAATATVTHGKAALFAASSAAGAAKAAHHHHVPPMSQHPTTLMAMDGASGQATSQQQQQQLVNPPPEGFYPCRTAADNVLVAKLNAGTSSASVSSPSSSSRKANGKTPSSITSATRTAATAAAAAAAASSPLSSAVQSRRNRPDGGGELTVLVDPHAVLQDYVQTQRERAKAFYVVGAALGRAFVDQQVLPLPLCAALSIFLRVGVPPSRLLLDATARVDPDVEVPIDLMELPPRVAKLVDPSVASSLDALAKLDAATLTSLELPFTLPGDDNFELIPGGAHVLVTPGNVRRYQRRVVNALLYDSVTFPLRMLTMGCHDVVPRDALGVLGVQELMALLCGEDKNASEPLWTADEIASVLVGDHGYQNDSPQLEMLGKILSRKLTPQEQRAFLLFCTGCPRLPVGGVRALGAITVVKRSNAFAHARGMAAAAEEERDSLQAGEDDEDNRDDPRPPFGAATSAASERDGTSSTGPREVATWRTVSSISHAGGMGMEEVASLDFELPDSEWALPSVNTCFRYLKLPPYPSEDLMYRKLLLSITQCGDTFELS